MTRGSRAKDSPEGSSSLDLVAIERRGGEDLSLGLLKDLSKVSHEGEGEGPP